MKLNKTFFSFAYFFTLVFIALLGSFYILATPTNSQAISQDELTQNYRVSFPIPELGNCASKDECKAYCNDSANKEACVTFAKQKGFYKAPNNSDILSAARSELGCDSKEACKLYCGEQENWQKCGEFAKKHGLGPKKSEGSPNAEILDKAKSFLGCTSSVSCREFCSNPDNHQKCEAFSQLIGMHKPEEASQAGCTSAMCRAYCDRYPEKCREFSAGGKPHLVPDRNLPKPATPTGVNSGLIQKEEYCRQYPEKCNLTIYPKPSFDPALRCQNYAGCTWTGNVCQCAPVATGASTVKGISTEENLLQKLLHLIGF